MKFENLIVLIEGEAKSREKWLTELDIDENTFEKFELRGVFVENQKNLYRNSFVGAINTRSYLIYSLPKFFLSEPSPLKQYVRHAIRLIEKSLRVYKHRIDNSKAIKSQEAYYLSIRNLSQRTEFDLYLSLKELFLKRGVFRKKKNQYQSTANFQSVNWQKTMGRISPVISQSVFFPTVIANKKKSIENPVSDLHLSVLSILANRYYLFEDVDSIKSFLTLEGTNVYTENDLKNNSSYWITLVQNELRQTFEDDWKEVHQLLIEYFKLGGFQSQVAFTLFGTSHFHVVWEDSLRVTLNDQYQEHKKEFGQAHYILQNGQLTTTQQEPDILLSWNSIFLIVDAKYYVMDVSKPGWKDIVKQLFYRKSFRPTIDYEKILNYFMTPQKVELSEQGFSKDDILIGQIEIRKDNQILDDFDVIYIMDLNPTNVLAKYCRNQVLSSIESKIKQMHSGPQMLV